MSAIIDVKAVAKLARLEISGDEEIKYQKHFNEIFKYFEEISVVDTSQVEPLTTPTDLELVFREDFNEQGFSSEEAMSNAPERQGNLFRVPPVV
jgi:aspartyl-tRNA(Asn)/glutamyl-tRNA(Gln) amidotransferase subunit C